MEWREALPPPGARVLAGTRCARTCRAAAEESRGELEARERVRWRPRLLRLLGEMEAPSLEVAESCMDHGRALDGITGRARLNPVRSCVRAGEMLRSILWPMKVVRFIDYVRARAAEPVGLTVPNQALRAMACAERAAGFDPSAVLPVVSVIFCPSFYRRRTAIRAHR
ncbi:unnamed protein product, partial [Prorocentrum cordatum]